MGLFDKIIKGISTRVSDPDPLHKVTEADHQSAVIKERPDLCEDIKALPQKQNVRRDGARDIAFNGWQICNVEERDPKHKDKTHIGEDRRLGYLKLFKTKNDKFVCQRMWLVDDEEKHYKATPVDDIIGIKDFLGNDSLALAMMMMLDRISKNW